MYVQHAMVVDSLTIGSVTAVSDIVNCAVLVIVASWKLLVQALTNSSNSSTATHQRSAVTFNKHLDCLEHELFAVSSDIPVSCASQLIRISVITTHTSTLSTTV
jgi:hypothetical protein